MVFLRQTEESCLSRTGPAGYFPAFLSACIQRTQEAVTPPLPLVRAYMLIKISGKLQAAMLCLSQSRPTMTCWVHQSWCNQPEQDKTDLRGCRHAHAKYTLSIRIMEWCFNQSLLLGISHIGLFCSGGFDSVVGLPLKIQSAGSPKMCIFTDTHISGSISNLSRREKRKKNKKAIIVRWLWAYSD